MNTPNSSPVVLNADTEHSGLRLAVLASFFVSFVLVFLILAAILRSFSGTLISDFYFALSCAGGVILAIGAAGLAEYIAKRRWSSGRSLTLNDGGLVAIVEPPEKLQFSWDGHNSVVRWYTRLRGYRRGGRERRVSADWLCVACQLQQDESRVIVFAYMPEDQAQSLMEDKRFQELRPGDFYKTNLFRRWFTPPSRPDIPTKVLVGKKGHFWLAERRRWNEGLELDIEDFFVLLDELDRQVEE
jgi:hypothetical protein